MIRSPCFSANIKEMVSISPKRSRSGAKVAMAPSKKTRFLTNNMSSLGMRAPSASSDLIDRCSSPTNSSAVSVVGIDRGPVETQLGYNGVHVCVRGQGTEVAQGGDL